MTLEQTVENTEDMECDFQYNKFDPIADERMPIVGAQCLIPMEW